jgi:diguanylate cyclase (GGDEF)-like protein
VRGCTAATALPATFRSGDVVARLGGDEFAAIAAATHAHAARVLLERLRRELARVNRASTKWPVQLSVGVSVFEPAEPRALEQLLVAADNAMYEGKCARRAG